MQSGRTEQVISAAHLKPAHRLFILGLQLLFLIVRTSVGMITPSQQPFRKTPQKPDRGG
jgi:hypothetical protein